MSIQNIFFVTVITIFSVISPAEESSRISQFSYTTIKPRSSIFGGAYYVKKPKPLPFNKNYYIATVKLNRPNYPTIFSFTIDTGEGSGLTNGITITKDELKSPVTLAETIINQVQKSSDIYKNFLYQQLTGPMRLTLNKVSASLWNGWDGRFLNNLNTFVLWLRIHNGTFSIQIDPVDIPDGAPENLSQRHTESATEFYLAAVPAQNT